MERSLHDLNLDHLYVIYPGQHQIPPNKKITATGLEMWIKDKKTYLKCHEGPHV